MTEGSSTQVRCACCRKPRSPWEVGSWLEFDDGKVRWRCEQHSKDTQPLPRPNPHPSTPRSDMQYHGDHYQP